MIYKKSYIHLVAILLLILSGCSIETSKSLNFETTKSEFYINIRDLTSPKLVYKQQSIEVDVGELKNFDIKQYVTVVDNVDNNLKLKVKGKYDLSIAGNYQLDLVVEDLDGNKTEGIFEIIVNEKKTTPVAPLLPNYTPFPNTTTPSPSLPQPAIKPNHSPSPVPSPKKIMFAEGYTYQTSYDTCVSEGQGALNSNQASSYTCEPIKENGEYLGYLLTFK